MWAKDIASLDFIPGPAGSPGEGTLDCGAQRGMSSAGEKQQKEGVSGLSLKSCLYLAETLPSTGLTTFAQGTLNISYQE